ncbi:MAG: polysaccharide biosynthesis protein, partial [Deltaproteobacteria bacterium]
MKRETEITKKVPMSAPDITEEDVQAVAEVVRSGRLALGPKTEEFEHLIAEYVGVKHAVAVSSGTAALHLIVKALGIGPGDEVLVPSFTFVASVNVILYEGATPVFVDIEPDTYNLDPE